MIFAFCNTFVHFWMTPHEVVLAARIFGTLECDNRTSLYMNVYTITIYNETHYYVLIHQPRSVLWRSLKKKQGKISILCWKMPAGRSRM